MREGMIILLTLQTLAPAPFHVRHSVLLLSFVPLAVAVSLSLGFILYSSSLHVLSLDGLGLEMIR